MKPEERKAYVEYVKQRGTERTSLSPVKGKDPWTAKPIAIVAEPLKLAPQNSIKKLQGQIGVWDALVLADSERYQRELQLLSIQKAKQKNELKLFYDEQTRQRRTKELTDRLTDLSVGQHLNQIANDLAKNDKNIALSSKKQQNLHVMEGVLQNLQHKTQTAEADDQHEKS